MRSVALVLTCLVTACPPAVSPCSAVTCAGCCSMDGRCELGQATTECGRTGAACTVCGLGLECQAGLCAPAVMGGGTAGVGGGAAGGSVSGTGGGTVVGSTTQELVSGSRLRAIHFVGADGSKAPAGLFGGLFWDTMLQDYCTPSTVMTEVMCAPLQVSTGVPLTDGGTAFSGFGDAACTRALGSATLNSVWLAHARAFARSALPPLSPKAFFHPADGGSIVTRGTPYSGPVFRNEFGCRQVGETNEAGVYVDSQVRETNAAPMSLVRD